MKNVLLIVMVICFISCQRDASSSSTFTVEHSPSEPSLIFDIDSVEILTYIDNRRQTITTSFVNEELEDYFKTLGDSNLTKEKFNMHGMPYKLDIYSGNQKYGVYISEGGNHGYVAFASLEQGDQGTFIGTMKDASGLVEILDRAVEKGE